MSLHDLRLLSTKFGREVGEKISDILAFWISGSLARGDFIFGISDVDLELVVNSRPSKVSTTDDMDELREVTTRFRRKAIDKGATTLHCFVKERDDLQETFQSLDLALHAETVLGRKPSEFFDLYKMKKNVRKLAMKTIQAYSKMGLLVLENRQPDGVESLEDSIKLVIDTYFTPAPLRAAMTVMKAANFALLGDGEWKKPAYVELFKKTFPRYRDFAEKLWEYRLDQNKLREKGEESVRSFLIECIKFTVKVEKLLSTRKPSRS